MIQLCLSINVSSFVLSPLHHIQETLAKRLILKSVTQTNSQPVQFNPHLLEQIRKVIHFSYLYKA
jgi:hypothetical protein